jgi:hypothetical protein
VIEAVRGNSISLFALMKRFRVIDKSQQDVIILDEEGSDFIKYCIPSLNSYVFIPIRNKMPIVLNIKFLPNIFFKNAK